MKLFSNVTVCRRARAQECGIRPDAFPGHRTWTKQTPFGTIGQVQIGSQVCGFPLNPDDVNDPWYQTLECLESLPEECRSEARDCE